MKLSLLISRFRYSRLAQARGNDVTKLRGEKLRELSLR
jgi:hypothetical protein